MRVTLAATGRARNEPEALLFVEYWKRAAAIGPKLGFTGFEAAIFDTSRKSLPRERADDECDRIGRKLPRAAQLIALDERGKCLSSEAFAQYLARLRDSAAGDLCFVIGGPDGLSPSLRQAASTQIAFGTQTWPHLLVRVMLAEQIYRALTILSGHPYHRA